jgi:hypothetical protein
MQALRVARNAARLVPRGARGAATSYAAEALDTRKYKLDFRNPRWRSHLLRPRDCTIRKTPRALLPFGEGRGRGNGRDCAGPNVPVSKGGERRRGAGDTPRETRAATPPLPTRSRRSAGILHQLEQEELQKWQLGRVYPV